jgi:hypothetical protein
MQPAATHHKCESLRSYVERKNFDGVGHKEWRVCEIVKQEEEEDQYDCSCDLISTRQSVQPNGHTDLEPFIGAISRR